MWQISIRAWWWVCVYSFSKEVPGCGITLTYMHVDVVNACQFLYENDTIMKWKLALSTTVVFFLKGSTTVVVCTCFCVVMALIYGEIKAWFFFLYCGFFICLARLVCYFIALLIISCLWIFRPPHIIISGSHLYMR